MRYTLYRSQINPESDGQKSFSFEHEMPGRKKKKSYRESLLLRRYFEVKSKSFFI